MTRQKNPQLCDTHALLCSPKVVALGRFLQNPLAMIAAVCRLEREILSWNPNDDETPIEFVKKNLPLLIGVLVHIYAKDLEKSNNKNKR